MLSLARGYVSNTTCVGEYKEVINSIEQYNKELKDVNK